MYLIVLWLLAGNVFVLMHILCNILRVFLGILVQAKTQIRHLGKSGTHQQSIVQIALCAYLNYEIVKLKRWDIDKQLIWKRFRQRRQQGIYFQRS